MIIYKHWLSISDVQIEVKKEEVNEDELNSDPDMQIEMDKIIDFGGMLLIVSEHKISNSDFIDTCVNYLKVKKDKYFSILVEAQQEIDTIYKCISKLYTDEELKHAK